METLIESFIDFVRVRQLNIALAGVLTLIYLVYQYWGLICSRKVEEEDDDDDDSRRSVRASRSRSRSCSRSRPRSNYHDYKIKSDKGSRRGRKAHRRCPDCTLCNHSQ